jgi:hypothetical protein
MTKQQAIVPERAIESQILMVRGQKVILDRDLAQLYGVTVKALNQQVKRNPGRFPPDFVLQLNAEEFMSLRSQFVTSKPGRGGRRYLPLAFTEHGAIMAASVLNSPRAVEMSLFVVRAFVRLREVLGTSKEVAAKVAELEGRLETHNTAICQLIAAIKQLTQPAARPQRRVGFQADALAKPKALKARAGMSRL